MEPFCVHFAAWPLHLPNAISWGSFPVSSQELPPLSTLPRMKSQCVIHIPRLLATSAGFSYLGIYTIQDKFLFVHMSKCFFRE